jgi:hypothetical protein
MRTVPVDSTVKGAIMLLPAVFYDFTNSSAIQDGADPLDVDSRSSYRLGGVFG